MSHSNARAGNTQLVRMIPRNLDPSAYMFSKANFTLDNTWRDLDLSAHLPAGATAVYFNGYIALTAGVEALGIQFRRNGNVNAKEIQSHYAFNAGTEGCYCHLLVPCDVNRVIEYKGPVDTWNHISALVFNITGYVVPYYDSYVPRGQQCGVIPAQRGIICRNADPAAFDKVLAGWTKNAWTDWDLSSIVPAGATMVWLYVETNTSNPPDAIAFRRNGNSNTYEAARVLGQVADPMYSYGGMLWVPCDANRVIEYFVDNSIYWKAINATVMGWCLP